MKMKTFSVLAILALTSCSLLEPKKDELSEMTEAVLKKEGVDIRIEPIEEEKK